MRWNYCSSTNQNVILLTMIVATASDLVMSVLAQCPAVYWDRPSKICADLILTVLHDVTQLPASTALNKTCRSWENSNSCYQQLRQECHSDDYAVATLKAHVRRYLVYSLPCQDRNNPNNRILLDCFLAYLTPTQTCAEAFDKFFRRFVVEKQYNNACRVVSSSLKCFHELKNKIRDRCGSDGADEYYRSYIQLLVDQSRDIVATKCTIAPPYDEDYKSSASSSITTYASRGRRGTGGEIGLDLFLSRQTMSMFAAVVAMTIAQLLIFSADPRRVGIHTATVTDARHVAKL